MSNNYTSWPSGIYSRDTRVVHYSNISVIKHVTRLKEKKTKPIIPISAEQEFDKNSTSIRDKNFQKNSPCFSFSLSASCPLWSCRHGAPLPLATMRTNYLFNGNCLLIYWPQHTWIKIKFQAHFKTGMFCNLSMSVLISWLWCTRVCRMLPLGEKG